MNDIIARLYGGNPSATPTTPSYVNPNWSAGAAGQAVGGLGNTDGYGNPVTWSQPSVATGNEGEIVETPAGMYRVVMTDGGYALQPENGALKGVSATINNMSVGEHNFGIDPATGEVWYQQAVSAQQPVSYASDPAYEAPQNEGSANNVQSSTTNTGAATGSETLTTSSSTAYSGRAPTNNFKSSEVRGLSNRDYIKALNQYLGATLFEGLI